MKTIKELIKKEQERLNKMSIVAKADDLPAIRELSFARRVEIISEEYKKFGKRIEREDLGTVDLQDKLVRQALNYINTEEELACFFVIPKVIKRGIIVDEREDHKRRGYESLTICAPVQLCGKRANIGVALKRTKGYRYKMHRVLASDGSVFTLNK